MSEENPLPAASGSFACPNCGTGLPFGLRFCRQCGYRLGEGVAEYAATEKLPETNGGNRNAAQSFSPPPYAATENTTASMPRAFEAARFEEMRQSSSQSDYAPPPQAAGNNQTAHNNPFIAPFAPLAPIMPQQPFAPAAQCQTNRFGRSGGKRMPWFIWIILPLIIFGAMTAARKNRTGAGSRSGSSRVVTTGSWMGMDYRTIDGKATVEQIEIPGSPADQAGLVGGDIITGINNQPVANAGDAKKLFAQIPIGAAATVAYLRDGAALTTTLTAQSDETLENLEETFDNQEQGKWGIDDDDLKPAAVILPDGKQISGVRLGEPEKNDPAYLAGLKEGDIVIAYGDVPIRTGKELVMRIRRTKPLETVLIRIIRSGQIMELPIKVGER